MLARNSRRGVTHGQAVRGGSRKAGACVCGGAGGGCRDGRASPAILIRLGGNGGDGLAGTAHDGSLDGGRLHQVLGGMRRAKGWATGLGLQFGLDVDALLKKDPLQERVFVAEHQALVSSRAVGGLQVVKVGLMDADSLFQLLDVLSASLAESSLSLSVSLLALFRGSIDLHMIISKHELNSINVLKYKYSQACGHPCA